MVKIRIPDQTFNITDPRFRIRNQKYYCGPQCFGSGSTWICIEIAPLDPDPDPYWDYGSGSGFRTVEMVSKKENKTEILR